MKRFSIACAVLCLAFLSACGSSGSFYKREARWMENRNEQDLLRKFGPPQFAYTNTLAHFLYAPDHDQPPGPQVLSLYPTNVPGNLNVEIRTFSWPAGRIDRTVWFHQKNGYWISFYASEWNMDLVP
jgi:hypothetical protein